jgi:hypothetical protein
MNDMRISGEGVGKGAADMVCYLPSRASVGTQDRDIILGQRARRMDFYAVLDQIMALLQQRGRVSYQALKRQFNLDDAYLDDLKIELIDAQQVARDDNGRVLVWVGKTAVSPGGGTAPARPMPEQALQEVQIPPIAAPPPEPRLPDA